MPPLDPSRRRFGDPVVRTGPDGRRFDRVEADPVGKGDGPEAVQARTRLDGPGRSPPTRRDGPKQVGDLTAEGLSEGQGDGDRRDDAARLDGADGRTGQAGTVGQFLLGLAPSGSKLAETVDEAHGWGLRGARCKPPWACFSKHNPDIPPASGLRYRIPGVGHLGPGTRHRSRSDAGDRIPSV